MPPPAHEPIEKLSERIAAVEPLRARAKSSRLGRGILYGTIALGALPLLLGGVFGSAWFVGNYIAQSLALVVATLIGSLALICFLLFQAVKRVSRIGADAVPAFEDAYFEQVVRPSVAEAFPTAAARPRRTADLTRYHGCRLFREAVAEAAGWTLLEGGTPETPLTVESWHIVSSNWMKPGAERKEAVTRNFVGLLAHVDRPAPALRIVRPRMDPEGPGHQSHIASVPRRSSSGDAAFDETFHLLIERSDDPVPVVPEAVRRICVAVGRRTDLPFFVAMNESGVYFALLTPDPLPFEPGVMLAPKPEDLAADLERLRVAVAAVQTLAEAAARSSPAPAR